MRSVDAHLGDKHYSIVDERHDDDKHNDVGDDIFLIGEVVPLFKSLVLEHDA